MTDEHALPMPLPGSELIPSFARATVRDALHMGVITCLPETPMEAVARIMTTNHVHAVVVSGIEETSAGGEHLSWGIITALDLVGAALPGIGARRSGSSLPPPRPTQPK